MAGSFLLTTAEKIQESDSLGASSGRREEIYVPFQVDSRVSVSLLSVLRS